MSGTYQAISRNRRLSVLLATVGLLLSYYAYYVEISREEDPNYKAMCDISEQISCSNVFTSKYGKGFGIVGEILGDTSPLNLPNGIIGMFMYPVFSVFSLCSVPAFARMFIVLAIGANLVSIYLAYILFYILKDICVVCITTYLINFFLLICAFRNNKLVNKLHTREYREQFDPLMQRGVSKKRV